MIKLIIVLFNIGTLDMFKDKQWHHSLIKTRKGVLGESHWTHVTSCSWTGIENKVSVVHKFLWFNICYIFHIHLIDLNILPIGSGFFNSQETWQRILFLVHVFHLNHLGRGTFDSEHVSGLDKVLNVFVGPEFEHFSH